MGDKLAEIGVTGRDVIVEIVIRRPVLAHAPGEFAEQVPGGRLMSSILRIFAAADAPGQFIERQFAIGEYVAKVIRPVRGVGCFPGPFRTALGVLLGRAFNPVFVRSKFP
ncbi:hypothetical protein [Nitratireductor sp. XY-223]|uniref:hypothetical protein n=1 Tax=Nitratireductor sp. XY-223 TaxID=2561926 RepID=UPI00145A6582|nr:hypothetical protein [Nitratireductor sp. XY-223]